MDFFREHLLLFKPWRSEEETLGDNIKSEVYRNVAAIKMEKSKYVHSEKLDDMMDEAIQNHDEGSSDEDEESVTHPHAVFSTVHEPGDIFTDMNLPKSERSNKKKDDLQIPVPYVIEDEKYNEVMQGLNGLQRKYLLHVLNKLKTFAQPLKECVIGGAGVGKSRLILALQQCVTRYINKPGTNLATLKVLLCAPTGTYFDF